MKTQQPKSIRYVIYARKSSESEDRQLASIDDQIQVLTDLAKSFNLNVVEVITESQSAKAPGRPGFSKLLDFFHDGRAEGVLCWKLNRLARNPIDGGQISWMLQNNIIKTIQCHGRDYKPTDNVLMMQVEFGMANQYVKDLSIDIRRGTNAKAKRGWYPTPQLPVGYMHNPKFRLGEDEILCDPERFAIIQKLWKSALSGTYNISELKRIGDKIGLRDPLGRPYKKCTYYQIFSHPFYCGYFFWNDENGQKIKYKGKHKPAVSEDDFNHFNAVISNDKPSTREKQYEFAFTGLITCGCCGCQVTAERKQQIRCTHCRNKFSSKNTDKCPKCSTRINRMKNPTRIDITYYRCTKRKGKCNQKYIRQEELEKMYTTILTQYSVNKSVIELAIQTMKMTQEVVQEAEKNKIQTLKCKLAKLKRREEQFFLMRADGEITNKDFIRFTDSIRDEVSLLETQIKVTDTSQFDWISMAVSHLENVNNMKKIINSGNKKLINQAFNILGSNQILQGKNLYFFPSYVAQAIFNLCKTIEAEKARFEPEITLLKSGQLSPDSELFLLLCTGANLVRTRCTETIIKRTRLLTCSSRYYQSRAA
ncbi:MAG: hypothetical protein GC181_10675 [Bacteroidetes bacterium]|nr:hypothetical protein [Bacteroidota bacterium]